MTIDSLQNVLSIAGFGRSITQNYRIYQPVLQAFCPAGKNAT